jgi:3-methyladenine DNA glycosylase AlkC
VQIIKNAEDLKNLWVQDSVLENLVDIDKELSHHRQKRKWRNQNFSCNRNGCR